MILKLAKLAAVVLLTFESVQGAGLYTGPRQPRTDCRRAECDYPAHSTKAHFSYEEGTCDEPSRWYQLAECWYECNNETHHFQSPVNIRLADAEYEPYPMFRIHSKLCKRVPGKIKNNGHAPHFEVAENDKRCDDSDSSESDSSESDSSESDSSESSESDSSESKECDDNGGVIRLTNVPMRPKDDVYNFIEMHTHLGRTPDKGSEHSLNTKFFPMETHMVFWNNKYSDVVEAKRSEDGLAVIGVFVKVAEYDDDEDDEDEWERKDDTPGMKWPRTGCTCDDDDEDCKKSDDCSCDCDDDCDGYNICRSDDDDNRRKYCSAPRRCDVRFAKKLNSLMKKYYPEIREYDQDADEKDIDEGITPRDALPYDWSFYTYKGSLTTPPCFQTVQWMVMRCPIKVSPKAFELLQQIEDSDHYPLKTYGVDRPTQRGLDGQYEVKVKRNFRWSEFSSRSVCYDNDVYDEDSDD